MSVKYMCSNQDTFTVCASGKLLSSVQKVQQTAHKYLLTLMVYPNKNILCNHEQHDHQKCKGNYVAAFQRHQSEKFKTENTISTKDCREAEHSAKQLRKVTDKTIKKTNSIELVEILPFGTVARSRKLRLKSRKRNSLQFQILADLKPDHLKLSD